MEGAATMSFFKKIYHFLIQIEHFVGHFFLLVIRLYWGGSLVSIGFKKLMDVEKTSLFFESLQIPMPTFMAWLVGAFELLGGASLLFGFLTPLFTIPLVVIFFVAFTQVYPDALFQIFSKPSAFIEASPFLYLMVSLIVLSFGPGLFSLDHWIERKWFKKTSS